MNSNNLITNALLATTWECSRKDYIDIISPFIIYATYHECDASNDYIDLNKVKWFVKNEFSISLIDSVIICAINRNTNYFLSKRISGSKHYYINRASNYDVKEFESRRSKNAQDYDFFIKKMGEFFSKKYSTAWSNKKLEDKLTKFITQNFSGILVSENKDSNYRDLELAEFLSYIKENDRCLVSILQNIVKGQMIYTALYTQNIAEADCKQKMRNLNVYFDTTFIFNLLGYGGKYNEEYAHQLADLLKGLGAKLFCFEHNYAEVRGILNACEQKLHHGQEDQLYNLDFFLDNNYSSSDMLIIISGLRDKISKYMVIVETPDYSMPTTCIDWKKFSSYLQEKINYQKNNSLNNDVESIAAMFRLREGKISQTLEGCGAIFVTTNLRLVKTVREYHKQFDDMSGYWSCLSDYEISNIAWLKSPDKQNEIVDRNIQYATALLQEPSQDFWRRFVEVVDKYKKDGQLSDSDAVELKYETYSRKNAGDFFNDDAEKIDIISLKELLSKIRRDYQEETLEKLEKSTSKITELKKNELEEAERKARKKGYVAIAFHAGGYLISSVFLLAIAGASVFHLIADWNRLWSWIVLSLEILGVIVSVIVPAIRKIWKIKPIIRNAYNSAYEKEKKKLFDEIEQKYNVK